MSKLIDDPAEGQNAPEFSVSEISGVVKRMIEGEFSHVRIRGEIGRVSRPASGHIYLDLKDDRAVLNGVIWKGVASRLRTKPEEGMEVVATGRLTTFPGQSRYQMIIENIAPAGVGALMAMLEKRKLALAAEGLFDASRKKPIPYLPEVIGVITSPSGAVIRDILHRLRDRFPRKVLIWGVPVQGEQCAPLVAAAIEGFNALAKGGAIPRPDLLIVARGGGSVEDLWGFNEEIVVRAAASSTIPLISAVGHETDTTLIDHASDQRAPTPTAAAELAVPVRSELLAHLAKLEGVRAVSLNLQNRRQRLRDLARALPKPADIVTAQSQRLDHLSARLPGGLRAATQIKRVKLTEASAGLRLQSIRRAISEKSAYLERVASAFSTAARTGVERRRSRLDGLERLRLTLGYKQTLRRGYAVIRDDNQSVITKLAAAKKAKSLEIEFQDGRFAIGRNAPVARKPSAAKKTGGDQGSLF
ncbi:MAG: exodeoxyribonuclease VII large subunit [Alphaproteobacteria bacterium]|nr:exodeoxyribonuclease VII large subunit [Alphaproteobacteria bacterium]